MKRAEEFRHNLSLVLPVPIHSALMEKHRDDHIVAGEALTGNVAGKTAIIFDDLISSGTTIARAAEVCRKHGAAEVYAAASHGNFSKTANEAISNPALDKVVITNSIPPFQLNSDLAREKLIVLDATPLFAEAIRRMHSGESIVELLAA